MSNHRDKRIEILMAAIKIFGKDGFHKAKVSDIAIEANIGKGTIYEYFRSKKNLFEEMIQFCIDRNLKITEEAIQKECNILDKLKRYIDIEKQMMIQYGNIANIFIQEADKIGQKARETIFEARSRKISLIKNILSEGIDKGLFRNVNKDTASLVFLGGSHQILVDEVVFNCIDRKTADIERFLDLFINGIKSE